jgi:hypothetical protein
VAAPLQIQTLAQHLTQRKRRRKIKRRRRNKRKINLTGTMTVWLCHLIIAQKGPRIGVNIFVLVKPSIFF